MASVARYVRSDPCVSKRRAARRTRAGAHEGQQPSPEPPAVLGRDLQLSNRPATEIATQRVQRSCTGTYTRRVTTPAASVSSIARRGASTICASERSGVVSERSELGDQTRDAAFVLRHHSRRRIIEHADAATRRASASLSEARCCPRCSRVRQHLLRVLAQLGRGIDLCTPVAQHGCRCKPGSPNALSMTLIPLSGPVLSVVAHSPSNDHSRRLSMLVCAPLLTASTQLGPRSPHTRHKQGTNRNSCNLHLGTRPSVPTDQPPHPFRAAFHRLDDQGDALTSAPLGTPCGHAEGGRSPSDVHQRDDLVDGHAAARVAVANARHRAVSSAS